MELPDGRLVPITDEELERLPLPTRHVAEVLGFVPASDIDPISYDRAYYAEPDGRHYAYIELRLMDFLIERGRQLSTATESDLVTYRGSRREFP
ncbi:Ku protein [Streptomyces lydicus]|uniref:Ku protein n=1 Tax=Streptomyces lydicus TaxID=47763 RepID=UPI0036CA423C